MKYCGPLYGKLAGKCFNTGKTSDDWDAIKSAADRRLAILKEIITKTNILETLPDDLHVRVEAELSQSHNGP